MSNADELLTDIRQSRRDLDIALGRMGDCAIDTEDILDPLADIAARLSGLVGQLDDHMSASATPPADWPTPAGGPATTRDRIAKAITSAGLTESAQQADLLANAIVAQLIREGN